MICPLHRIEVRRSGDLYDCPRCCNLWPDLLLEEHQPPNRAEIVAKRKATLAKARQAKEEAMLAWLRTRSQPQYTYEIAAASYDQYRDRARRLRHPPWPTSPTHCAAYLRSLEAQGRVERTPKGWRAKE